MKSAVLGLVAAALVLVPASASIDYVNYPSSDQPAFISGDLVRFQTNLGTRTRTTETYVVRADGTGLRPATPEEAAAAPVSGADRLEFDDPFRTSALRLVDATGRKHLVAGAAWAPGGAALSPDGRTVVFAAWVGWVYSDGSTLYSVPVDGSAQPRRLTPTSCTVGASTRSSLRGRCFDGSDAADRIVGLRGGDVIIAGSGADTIRAGDGNNIVQSQWGDDDIRSGAGPDWIWAGDGADTIASGAGSDRIDPGGGRDVVHAGSGADYVYANDGRRDVIDCGKGDDRAIVDPIDVLHGCEHWFVGPPTTVPAFS